MPSATKRRERERAARRRKVRTVVVAAAGAALLLGVAVGATLLSDSGAPTGVAETRPVEITGDPLPQLGPGTDPTVGMPVPELRGRSFDGSQVAIADDGVPKAIWFLAHWCPHCQAEVPRIVDLVTADGVPEGVDLYSVSTGADPTAANYPPSAWLEREGWTIPVLTDDRSGSAARAYGLNAFPFLVLVDADGRVVSRTSGEIDPGTLQSMLDGLAAS